VQRAKPRKPGALKGKIWIAEDFDAPLPEELLDLFAGKVEPKPRSSARKR